MDSGKNEADMRILKGMGLGMFLLVWSLTPAMAAAAFELNDDGRALIQEARQAYDSEMRDRPVLLDASVGQYVRQVVDKLIPKDRSLPQGIRVSVTVLDADAPELTTYVDGHLVISSGLVFGVDNEAQLAGMLAPQVAHLTEGYYLALYQQIKAAQRSERRKAAVGAIFGVLLDAAVDYTVDVHSIELTDQVMSGQATYGETMKRLAALQAGQQAYYGIKDVIESIPAKDDQGRPMDPRLQFEPMADAQGLVFVAQAGYDPAESPRGCDNITRIRQTRLKEQERMMGAFAQQLRDQRSLMEAAMARLRQNLGGGGLVQTMGLLPPSRGRYLASLMGMQEIRTAVARGNLQTGQKAYQTFLGKILLPRARTALAEERYNDAHKDFQRLYARGVRTAPVAYGLAKSKLGDFAFGASAAELKAAAKAYREAIKLDPSFAEPHRGLAELYSDTDEYEKAVKAWQTYLRLAPATPDRRKIERKIKMLKRKAQR
jgi:predicted Zn-dependent protease